MEYYGGRLCVSMRELVDGGIMTEPNYKQMARRGRFEIARQGKGSGNYALVIVESLPTRYKEEVHAKYGTGEEVLMTGWLKENYQRDQAAVAWFNDRSKCPVELNEEQKEKYIINASVLNCCIHLHDRATLLSKLAGESYQWEKMATAIKSLQELFGHTLPTSVYRFRKQVARYRKEGYASLLSGKFGNQNKRLMTARGGACHRQHLLSEEPTLQHDRQGDVYHVPDRRTRGMGLRHRRALRP